MAGEAKAIMFDSHRIGCHRCTHIAHRCFRSEHQRVDLRDRTLAAGNHRRRRLR